MHPNPTIQHEHLNLSMQDTKPSQAEYFICTSSLGYHLYNLLENITLHFPAEAIKLCLFKHSLINTKLSERLEQEPRDIAHILLLDQYMDASIDTWSASKDITKRLLEKLKHHLPEIFTLQGRPDLELTPVFHRFLSLSRLNKEYLMLAATKRLIEKQRHEKAHFVVFTTLLPAELIYTQLLPVIGEATLTVCLMPVNKPPSGFLYIKTKSEWYKKYEPSLVPTILSSSEHADKILMQYIQAHLNQHWQNPGFKKKSSVFRCRFKFRKIYHSLLNCLKRIKLKSTFIRRSDLAILNTTNSQKVFIHLRLLKPVLECLTGQKRRFDLVTLPLPSLDLLEYRTFAYQNLPQTKYMKFKVMDIPQPYELQPEFKKLFSHLDVSPIYENPDITDEERVLLHNLVLQYQIIVKTAVALNYLVEKPGYKHILGVMDIYWLTTLSILKQFYNNPVRIHALQFGVAAVNHSFDTFIIDNFFVTDAFARQVYEKQHCATRNYTVIGSTEWEDETSAITDDALTLEIAQWIAQADFTVCMFNQPLEDNFIDKAEFLKKYRILYQFAESHPATLVLIKPHYRDDLELLGSYLPERDNVKIIPPGTSNTFLFEHIDVAVSFYSFVLSKAVVSGVPALGLYITKANESFMQFIASGGGYATNDEAEALNWLTRLYQDQAYRETLMAQLKQFHTDVMQHPPSLKIIEAFS